MRKLTQSFMLGGSATVMLAVISAAALAQDTGVEQVIVTGTSIRGVAPIGSSLVTLDQATIQSAGAQNIQELMQTVPSMSNANAITQGEIRSDYYSPSIHDLGASASNSTLIVFDGHRAPQGDTQHSETDPNIIPIAALQRVEVLATGASSIYGSDAVAGVINFITRQSYEGLQLSAQAKEGNGYSTYTGNVLLGRGWQDGNAYFAYSHIWESPISNASRPWIGGDHTAQGGTNFNSFNCPSPTLQVGSNYWLGPNYTTSVTSAQANAPCNLSPYSQIVSKEIRDNAMFKVTQKFGRLTVTADMIVGIRQNFSPIAPGTGSVTAYGPGSGKGGQINPFFEAPAGAPGATTETVRFFALGLIPAGQNSNSATTIYSDINAIYNVDDNWQVTLSNTLGKDATRSVSYGGLCASCVNLALNGTTNAAGNTTTVSIPGTNTLVLGTPLTADNALDIWNAPGTANRTSAAVLAGLTNTRSSNIDYNSFNQLRLVADGALFDLPGGPLKLAIGMESIRYGLIQDIVSPNNTGPSSTGTSFNEYRFKRTVTAGFLELAIPVIGPEMNVPLVHKLDFDISGRIDDYSDVGHTSNPKFAATWEIIDGLKVFGNYSTAFVAPPLDSAGAPNYPFDGHYNSGATGVSTWSGAFSLPTNVYPGIAGVLPGCAATAKSCNVATSAVQGIEIYAGLGPELKPATGNDWTVGIDFAPAFLPGLSGNATYFGNIYKGGVTSPNPSGDVLSPALQGLIVPCPTGCSATEIATRIAGTPITGSLPNTAYFFIYYNQRNVINMNLQGVDFTLNYEFPTEWGAFVVGDSATVFTHWQENYGGGPDFNVLNHEGVNTTFPAVQIQSRAHVGWTGDALAVDLFANFTGGYRNWSSNSVNPVVTDSNGLPVGGGDVVKSNITFDGHVAYNFQSEILGGDQIYVDVKNMFSRRPPFFNQTQGYDYFVASPLGRVVSLGLRASF